MNTYMKKKKTEERPTPARVASRLKAVVKNTGIKEEKKKKKGAA